MSDPVIYLGFVHPGIVHYRWMESVLMCLPEFRMIVAGSESGPLLSRARNMILEGFLRNEQATHLLFTDTDIVFKASDVQLLLEAEKPIVGALYFGILGSNPDSTFPVVLGPNADGVLQSLDSPPSELSPVSAVGMGLTLIERRVIEALDVSSDRNTPFAETFMNGRHHGEDVTFCLRAAEAGFETWLEPRARVGHRKTIIL